MKLIITWHIISIILQNVIEEKDFFVDEKVYKIKVDVVIRALNAE